MGDVRPSPGRQVDGDGRRGSRQEVRGDSGAVTGGTVGAGTLGAVGSGNEGELGRGRHRPSGHQVVATCPAGLDLSSDEPELGRCRSRRAGGLTPASPGGEPAAAATADPASGKGDRHLGHRAHQAVDHVDDPQRDDVVGLDGRCSM